MTTSLSRQLAGIAATSTNQLDLRAQRHAHSQSLLFDPKVAATQDFDTIYDYCIVGFQELCRLEPQFGRFSHSIFSEASKNRERGQLNKAENAELDGILERFLVLSCRHLMLLPAQKALEWLIRRYRVHEHNTETLVLTLLIYHPLPIFATLLSILPKQIPRSLKFLHPYRERLQPLPGDVIQHATATNAPFFDAWTGYVLKSCKWGYQHDPMLSYWTIRVATAVEKQLEPVKTGGVQAQQQRENDVARKITTILEKGLSFRKIPSMLAGCYIILYRMVLAANLKDATISTFMDAVADSATKDVGNQALLSLAVLAQKRKSNRLSPTCLKFLLKLDDLTKWPKRFASSDDSKHLATSLAIELIHDMADKPDSQHEQLLLDLLTTDMLGDSLETVVTTLCNSSVKAGKAQNDGSKRFAILISQLVNRSTSIETVTTIRQAVGKSTASKTLKDTVASMLRISAEPEPTGMIMDIKVPDVESTTSDSWRARLLSNAVTPLSYLKNRDDELFDRLAAAFGQLPDTAEATDEFLSLDLLDRSNAAVKPTFVSFFARYMALPLSSRTRARAILQLNETMKGISSAPHFQILIPYLLFALSDPAQQVRTAAVDLAITLRKALGGSKSQPQVSWGAQELYGSSEAIPELDQSQLYKFWDVAITPNLEAFKLDNRSIVQAIRDTLTPSGTDTAALNKSSRIAILEFLAGHARATPVLRITLTMLSITSGVSKSAAIKRYEAFRPLLDAWVGIDDDKLQQACMNERIIAKSLCLETVKVVHPSNLIGHEFLQQISTKAISSIFIQAIMEYVITSWSAMTPEIQYKWATLLFHHGVLHNVDGLLDKVALPTLSTVQLSTNILEALVLSMLATSTASGSASPSAKRRKTTNGAVSVDAESNVDQIKMKITRVITLLDLVRGSGSAARSSLIPGLFRIFQDIHKLRSVDIDLSHVHWLILVCLREVAGNTSKEELSKLDHSTIRIDLIVDTLTHAEDPQPQHAALILIAELAKLEPELVMNSMMPVFTFIGSSVLKQDDDHATYVVDQTINAVVPSLITSFNQQKGGALAGAAGLISSFVAAFEHILPRRRLDLFEGFINKLGPQEYLYVLFAVLQDRLSGKDGVQQFISGMLTKYAVTVQFKTIEQCLDLLSDSLQKSPKIVSKIFTVDDTQSRAARSLLLADLPFQLLQVPQLASRASKTLRTNRTEAQTIRTSYAAMVQQVLKLTSMPSLSNDISQTIAAIFGTLIGFFPVAESLRALNVVLQEKDDNIRAVVLQAFADTITKAQSGDSESRTVCLGLLPTLTTVTEQSKDVQLKQNAIRCVNVIIKKYGKTDIDKTLESARFVMGSQCLQYGDPALAVVSLQTLATISAVAGEAIVPLCPTIVTKSLEYLSLAVNEESWNSEVHNAVFALSKSLILNLPLQVVTGNSLDRFLELAYISASINQDEECDAIRLDTLETFAKKTAAQACFSAIARNWSRAVDLGVDAAKEHLQVLDTAIEAQPKSSITINASLLTDHCIDILDVRASRLDPGSDDWDADDVAEIEDLGNAILLKIIYKLNDTHFKPLFKRMNGWATNGKSTSEVVQTRRLTSWFSFMQAFSTQLQSVVTDYYRYVIDAVVEVLSSVDVVNQESRLLWQKTIQMLTPAFEHDQTDFWKSPMHFDAICNPLINQLRHGSLLTDDQSLIQCVTEFAVAVESAEHRAAIHSKILEHFRSEDARVRRAMFTCEISLTEALGEAWITLFESSSTYPVLSEAFEDDDESVEVEALKWKRQIEDMTGESLDTRLQ